MPLPLPSREETARTRRIAAQLMASNFYARTGGSCRSHTTVDLHLSPAAIGGPAGLFKTSSSVSEHSEVV
jgi:hypothetical protein